MATALAVLLVSACSDTSGLQDEATWLQPQYSELPPNYPDTMPASWLNYTATPCGTWAVNPYFTPGKAEGNVNVCIVATYVEADLELSLHHAGQQVATAGPVTNAESNHWPWDETTANVNTYISTGLTCGAKLDAYGNYLAKNIFWVTGVEWGQIVDSDTNSESQAACQEPGGFGEPYGGEGECYICQQWFWYENGEIVDEWWDCEPTDPELCEDPT
jgi:hypothetical protein